MKTVHIGARVSADLATALAIMARDRGTSLSEEYRLAVVAHLQDWARNDDDLAEQGEAVSTNSPMQAASDALPAG